MDYAETRQFNLRTLRYFIVLAEELHFGRAAARLNMSQPPLSQQIRQLEEQLGADLFRRSHHGVTLTPAGLAFREQVPLVFEQLERAVSTARLTARGQIGRLEIGVISSSLVGVVPAALEAFRIRHPDVEWQLHELTPQRQIEALLERRLDICLFRLPSEHEGLCREVIMQEDLMVALPSDHALARRPALRLADLHDQPFVMFGLNQSRFADFLYQCCVQAGFTPQIRQQVVEVQSLLSLVGANMGVALLPASMQRMAQPNVAFRRILPAPPQVPLYAIYREGDPLPTLAHFLTILRRLRPQPTPAPSGRL
ncbi:LysR substrate-binding domain-containing protein [Paracoccus sp. (in: a-proteobacteria)]|uniref:LysR substrate-binding domain-containing protein n=1 Tax=Paracoccus sp. TaxID=267 RepID=UPI0032200028